VYLFHLWTVYLPGGFRKPFDTLVLCSGRWRGKGIVKMIVEAARYGEIHPVNEFSQNNKAPAAPIAGLFYFKVGGTENPAAYNLFLSLNNILDPLIRKLKAPLVIGKNLPD